MSILRFLVEAEAKPLAQAGLEAVSAPARRATGRVAWGVGMALAALILLAVSLGIGAVALASYSLSALPEAIEPLAWASGGIAAIAALFAIIAMRMFASLSADKLYRYARHAYRDTRLSQPPLGSATKSVQQHLAANSYSFARGFADGFRAN